VAQPAAMRRPLSLLAGLCAAALAGCGADPLWVQQSGSGDLLIARTGGALIFCVRRPRQAEPCTRAAAEAVVPDAPPAAAWAEWINDNLVLVRAFGGAEIVCRPTALGGEVRVMLRRLPRETMPASTGWADETDRMFDRVPDSCA